MSLPWSKLRNSLKILPQAIMSAKRGAWQFNSGSLYYKRKVQGKPLAPCQLSSARVFACGDIACNYVVLALDNSYNAAKIIISCTRDRPLLKLTVPKGSYTRGQFFPPVSNCQLTSPVYRIESE